MLSFVRLRRSFRKRRSQWSAWAAAFRRLAPYLAGRRRDLIVSMLFGLGYTAVGMAEPWPLKMILDHVLLDQAMPGFLAPTAQALGGKLGLLNVLVAAVVILAVLRGIFYYYQKLLSARAGQQITAHLRLDLYRHLQRLSFRFHDRRRTGDLLSRLTGDIRLLRDVFINLPLSMTSEIFLVTGMIAVMLLMDWQLTLLAMAALPGIAIVLRLYQGPMRRAIRRQRDREGDLASIGAETLGAIRVVQGFGREAHEVKRFGSENKRSLRSGMKAARLSARLNWYAEVSVACVTAVVLGVAARRVLGGALSPGELIVFLSYLRVFNRPLRRVSRMAERAARGAVAGERVMEMMDVTPDIVSAPDAVRARRVKGRITFENVSFKHHKGPMVLRRLDLDIAPGERVALIGDTGSGKSTLASLIPRFYDVTKGRVCLDGRDVRELTVESLRAHIAVVFQEPVLFSGSILENIGYGRPEASREEIEEAAEKAGIHEIIDALPEGYDTAPGERGATLSGGQRQCVAIARAMIRNAPIIILDEPATGLDARSAAQVNAALEKLMRGRTVILISHQLDQLGDIDRVLRLDGGRIVEQGSLEDMGLHAGPSIRQAISTGERIS